MSHTDTIRRRAGELLATKEVAMVVGYRAGSGRSKAQPAFITTPEQADLLVFDETCGPNLANYLLKVKHLGRIAVVAKGCDSRSILVLVKEKQLDRNQLLILGVTCPGVTENGNPSDSCATCQFPNPVVFDEMVGDAVQPRPADKSLDEFGKLSPDERWQALSDDVARCIRCYACRQVCPNCYCPACFVDSSQPQLVGKTTDHSDNMSFHIMRAMHMAGRCVECGSCARACPVGVDLMKFNRKVARIVKDRFATTAGANAEEPPALAAFEPGDKQEFIR